MIETTNVQFMNQAFINKVTEEGHTKEASVAMSAFVRQKLREDGFARKILNPKLVTAADLDRQTYEEPTIICEKEPDSVAASLPLVGRHELRYWKAPRYPVVFGKYESNEFKKSKFELATYRTDIRTVLQENAVKDLQKVEDKTLYDMSYAVANANSAVYTLSGGLTIPNFVEGAKKLLQKQLPVGSVLMTQSAYMDLLKQPATQIGSPLASALTGGQGGLENPFGLKIITTNKNDILPDNQMIFFAPSQYLGQMYLLQDALTYLKTEADMISFKVYESAGIGIGNTNAIAVVNF